MFGVKDGEFCRSECYTVMISEVGRLDDAFGFFLVLCYRVFSCPLRYSVWILYVFAFRCRLN